MQTPKGEAFRQRMSAAARRHVYIRRAILWRALEAPANPERDPIDDPNTAAAEIKALARDMGADAVGIADYDARLAFSAAEDRGHSRVIVCAMAMKYDAMVDIGPASQDEVHRVYHALDDLGVRLVHQIAAFGYHARAQTNAGDFPLPAYGYLAGLGELGRHGSLISPELGSSFRLVAVSTDMPLAADGPKDFGIDEVCARCNICTRFCPGDAIKPEKRDKYGVTRWHVDTPACEPWFFRLMGCKICLMVCPLNAKSVFKDRFSGVARDIREAKDADGLVRLISARSGIDFAHVEVPFEPLPEDEE